MTIDPDDYRDASWLIVIVAGVCGTILFALLLAYAFDAETCAARGGVYVRALWGDYECVRREP